MSDYDRVRLYANRYTTRSFTPRPELAQGLDGVEESQYCRVTVNGAKHYVHYLVCRAVHGASASDDLTVDHLDRVRFTPPR